MLQVFQASDRNPRQDNNENQNIHIKVLLIASYLPQSRAAPYRF